MHMFYWHASEVNRTFKGVQWIGCCMYTNVYNLMHIGGVTPEEQN